MKCVSVPPTRARPEGERCTVCGVETAVFTTSGEKDGTEACGGCLVEQRDAMHRALTYVALALESAVKHGEIEEWTESLYDGYETARAALGQPVQTFPGGYDGAHIHWMEQEECETCDEQEVARASGVVPSGGER